MGNARGAAARFAYNPAVLVAFIEHHTTYVDESREVKRRNRTVAVIYRVRLLNWWPFDQNVDGRMLRRWRTDVRGVTRPAAVNFLTKYDLTTAEFEQWAATNNHTAVAWDRTEAS